MIRLFTITELNLKFNLPAVDAVAGEAIPLISVKFHVMDRKTVWIDVNSLAWAMRYLHDQYKLQGVSLSVDSPGSASSSESKSPVSWSFQERGWVVEENDTKIILRPKDLQLQHLEGLEVELDSLEGLDYAKLKALAKQVMERKATQSA